jgi:hypothetical protein
MCYALTAKYKPCRGYPEPGSYVCRHHRDYFMYFDMTKICLVNLEFNSILRNHVKNALKRGIITPSKEFVKKMHQKPYHSYAMILFAKYSQPYGFDYRWNIPLLDLSIRNLWRWSGAIGPITVTISDLVDIISADPNELFYKAIYLYPYRTFQYTPSHWKNFFTECFEREWFTPVLHVSEDHDRKIEAVCKVLEDKEVDTSFLRVSYKEWFADEKVRYFKMIQSIVPHDVKEEIIEVAWNPDRMVDWCLDEDVKQNVKSWSSKN